MSDEQREAFAKLLRQLRAGARISQAELGERVGVDGSTVSSWERANSLPSREHVIGLSTQLDPDSWDLVTTAGYAPPEVLGEQPMPLLPTVERTAPQAQAAEPPEKHVIAYEGPELTESQQRMARVLIGLVRLDEDLAAEVAEGRLARLAQEVEEARQPES